MLTPSIFRFHYENVLRQDFLLKKEVFQFEKIRRGVERSFFNFFPPQPPISKQFRQNRSVNSNSDPGISIWNEGLRTQRKNT